MSRHRLANIALAITYALCTIVVYLDLTVWRPN